MHTVELLPDDELDSRVREMWGSLLDRGLPSLASHPHPTNRPHVTVVTAPVLDRLPELPLPIEVTFEPPRMLGRALVLPVTPSPALRTSCAGRRSDKSDRLSRLTAPARARISGRRFRS